MNLGRGGSPFGHCHPEDPNTKGWDLSCGMTLRKSLEPRDARILAVADFEPLTKDVIGSFSKDLCLFRFFFDVHWQPVEETK